MDTSLLIAVESLLHKNKKNIYTSSSVKNSPCFKRHNKFNISTSSLTSCPSQINNNYTNLDMESLEDMLKKVRLLF